MLLRTALWCVLAGSVLGGTLVHLRGAPARRRLELPHPVVVERVLPAPPQPPSPPSPVSHQITCGDPARIGEPLASPPVGSGAPRWWRVAAAAKACVFVAWSEADVVASWDDGATFTPLDASAARVVGTAVRDDGTIIVMREDYTLAIAYPDGSTLVRRLAFRGEPLARGRWLVIRGRDAPAISDDDGASWRQLEPPGSYLVDLHVLGDGTIVATVDDSMVMCDHFGCGGPTVHDAESHLDGRPWRAASRSHQRAAAAASRAPAGERDAHGLAVEVVANRYLVRRTAGGPRTLYVGAP